MIKFRASDSWYLKAAHDEPSCGLLAMNPHLLKNKGNLTDKEIECGYFMDPILGKCNIKKALEDKGKAMENEYEVFNNMHCNDGAFVKSKFCL